MMLGKVGTRLSAVLPSLQAPTNCAMHLGKSHRRVFQKACSPRLWWLQWAWRQCGVFTQGVRQLRERFVHLASWIWGHCWRQASHFVAARGISLRFLLRSAGGLALGREASLRASDASAGVSQDVVVEVEGTYPSTMTRSQQLHPRRQRRSQSPSLPLVMFPPMILKLAAARAGPLIAAFSGSSENTGSYGKPVYPVPVLLHISTSVWPNRTAMTEGSSTEESHRVYTTTSIPYSSKERVDLKYLQKNRSTDMLEVSRSMLGIRGVRDCTEVSATTWMECPVLMTDEKSSTHSTGVPSPAQWVMPIAPNLWRHDPLTRHDLKK